MIGHYIKDTVIPCTLGDVSVTELAARLDVGRPALSKLLNGRADLSVEMAWKIEKLTGFSGLALLKMQIDLDYKLVMRDRM